MPAETAVRFIFSRDGKDYCLVVEPDLDAESPREWENVGHLYCWHPRYNFGDENPYGDPQDFLDDIAGIPEDDIVLIPVEVYEHSAVSIYAAGSRVADRWDSGQVGWIFATREDADRVGCSWDSVRDALLSELDAYDKYLSNEVFAGSVHELEDGYDEDNVEAYFAEMIDSCGSIHVRETWGIGLAEEVLEVMGQSYGELRDI